jgi:hypothetical protein
MSKFAQQPQPLHETHKNEDYVEMSPRTVVSKHVDTEVVVEVAVVVFHSVHVDIEVEVTVQVSVVLLMLIMVSFSQVLGVLGLPYPPPVGYASST